MKIELSKDEIETIQLAVTTLIEDTKNDFLSAIDISYTEFKDLENIKNKFDSILHKEEKENEV